MNKYLVIGDVHARFDPFMRAVQYAIDKNLKLISLGDLCDGNHDGPDVFEVMASLVNHDSAFVIRGNHEYKIERYLKGNNVSISKDGKITVDQLESTAGFVENFKDVSNRLYDVLEIGDNIFAHGGIHHSWWETKEITKKNRSTFLFGESNNNFIEYGSKKWTIREYNWVENIPAGKTVFVGHDTRAMMEPMAPDHPEYQTRSDPFNYTNKNGGSVWFVDTGCGKKGSLSGMVINDTGDVTSMVNFGG